MRTKLINQIATIFGLILFGWALWVLYHELRVYHYHDIIRNVRSLPAARLLVALGLAFLDYLVLTGYDRLAFKYLQHPLAYKKIALTSFIGYAFSHNIGLTFLTGGSVRYRFYTAWGLSPMEIAKVVLFCGLTFWLGFFLIGGFAFWLQPLALPERLALPFHSLRWLGWLFLAAIALYLALCLIRNQKLRIRKVEFSLPGPGIALGQLAVSALDWLLVAGVLFTLLPKSGVLGFSTFLAVFLLAQIAGLVSQIPGGLGVFETVMLLLLEPYYPASAILGTLLVFRGVYYLLPLGGAILLLGSHEFLIRREHIQRIIRIFGKWAPGLLPNLMAVAVFVGGAILLFSGSVPAVWGRLQWLHQFLPLPVIEVSHFLASMAGVGLLFLAPCLQRRLAVAYQFTLGLLAAGLLFSLLKGADYEEAIAMAILLAALLPSRLHFYRQSSFRNQHFTLGWLAAVILVLTVSVWLGLFSYKHIAYDQNLWWRVVLADGAPRFLRASLGVFGAVLVLALSRLLRPALLPNSPPAAEELQSLERIVAGEPRTYAQLAFLPDKSWLFSDDRQACIMYSVHGRSWVAMGDPLGDEQAAPELIWRFKELADRYEGWTVYYAVGEKQLAYYSDLGLTLLKMGEEARVPLAGSPLSGGQSKQLVKHEQQVEKAGLRFEVVPGANLAGLLPALWEVSCAWLESRQTAEKKFALDFFDGHRLQRHPAALIRQQGRILAFASIWTSAQKEEAAASLLRCLPDTPEPVLDFLVTEMMLWARGEGYRWFNLGLAPLGGPQARDASPLWQAMSPWPYQPASRPHSWAEIRKYLEKFGPSWRPKYLAAPGGLILPKVLIALAALITGGDKAAGPKERHV